MASKYWGEIITEPQVNDLFIPDVTADIEKSMDKFCLAEYEDDGDREKVDNLVLPPLDPLVTYAISLHKYANDMTEMIRVAELATETNLIPPEDAAPPMPIMPDIHIKHKPNSLNFIPKELTDFGCGAEVEIPELSEAVVKKLLTKCIVTMFAHIGYETTHQSVLDLMTDVLESFLQKFCSKVVKAIEENEKGDISRFTNIIEKVLTETGMGGVKGLHDYYQNRVVKYINVLKKRCKELNDHYAVLLIPKSPPPPVKFSYFVRAKVEDDADAKESDNPEFHFSSFEGDSSVLESGLQLLHSLEAEENLQTLEEGMEDSITSASPGVVTMPPEGDMSNLAPFIKKKRFK